jgi:hypothetical protein
MHHHHHHQGLDGSQIANTAIGAYAGVRAAQGNWGPLVVVLLFSGGLGALFSGLMWLAVIAALIGVALTAGWLIYCLFVGLGQLANALRGIRAAWIFIPALVSLGSFVAAYYYSVAVAPLPVLSPGGTSCFAVAGLIVLRAAVIWKRTPVDAAVGAAMLATPFLLVGTILLIEAAHG